MDTDLASIIQSSQPLGEAHVQCFSLQILRGLRHLHAHLIVHRDLKPMNILVNSDCVLKLADFGLAKLRQGDNFSRVPPMTNYVTTRWYRAPEVLVGWHSYGFAIDLWAVGTIIAELLLRKPLFPGKDSVDQLEMVARYCGKPARGFIDLCKKPHVRVFLSSLPPAPPPATRLALHEKYGRNRQERDGEDCVGRQLESCSSPEALSLLNHLLVMDPRDRCGAEVALAHPFLRDAQHFLPHRSKPQQVGDFWPLQGLVSDGHSVASISSGRDSGGSDSGGNDSKGKTISGIHGQALSVVDVECSTCSSENEKSQANLRKKERDSGRDEKQVEAPEKTLKRREHRRAWGWEGEQLPTRPLPQSNFLFETRHPSRPRPHRSKPRPRPQTPCSKVSKREKGANGRDRGRREARELLQRKKEDDEQREWERLREVELEELREEMLMEGVCSKPKHTVEMCCLHNTIEESYTHKYSVDRRSDKC